jgi:deferrochelatase/peroxidase EfeB
MGDNPQDTNSLNRRGLLLGLSGGAALALGGRGDAQTRGAQVADAPLSDDADQSVPFFGPHQAGIVDPRPASGMVAVFDVIAHEPADVERLFRKLTERFLFLTQGGKVPELDAKLPPADSGILGTEIAPDGLTMTLALGSSFFDNRNFLVFHKPAHLQRMTAFPNDALDASSCHGDLAVQICANTRDATIHALRDLLKNLSDLMVLRWKQEGSVPVLAPRPGAMRESARNFLGFRDGSANPDAENEALMQQVVWVGEGDGEPAWAAGGTYQVVRIIRNFVERWDRTALGEQESIIGRRKPSGAPFDGAIESDVPNFSRDPKGAVTPLDAHIRLANPRLLASQANLILRRPFNYSNGVTKAGQLDQGLLFIAFQADLEAGFIAVQKRLNGEPLEEYIKPVGGGYFFALPGVTGPDDFLGRALLDAALKA